jgi:hypothetical protein
MMEGPCADSEEKREPAGDIDTVVVDGLKVLDPKRPIREADINAGFMVSISTRPVYSWRPGQFSRGAGIAVIQPWDFPCAQKKRRGPNRSWRAAR